MTNYDIFHYIQAGKLEDVLAYKVPGGLYLLHDAVIIQYVLVDIDDAIFYWSLFKTRLLHNAIPQF